MPGRLLSTKFFIPRPRDGTLVRPRLSELFDRAAQTKLGLVSAQAGFGKTTAIASWIYQGPGPDAVAWLSLEGSDAQPDTFWAHVVTALSERVPNLQDGVLPLLVGAGPPMTGMLTELVNYLVDTPEEIFLVLDDYHLVDSPTVAEGMSFLLSHLPPQTHLLLSTRSDPDLPLSRLRARGEVVEVRTADLRFTGPEAASYLRQSGFDLNASELEMLEVRTEGWAAALQLAALSMRDQPDIGDFIADFAGDDRFIVDYLVDEVLTRQPQATRDFLLRTSVLDTLTGSLCDAVTGQTGGSLTLRELERQNLFVVPLDRQRLWYRYHHLFADVLRMHLATDTNGPSPATLHDRASVWYEQDGQPRVAVEHALTAGNQVRAAALMEVAIPDMLRLRQEVIVADWVHRLSSDLVLDRPVLAMGFIAALMSCNDFESVATRLDDLEPQLLRIAAMDTAGGALPADLVAQVPSELPRLAGKAELYRAGLALVTGDLHGTHLHVDQVARLAAPDDHPTRAGGWGLSGLAYWTVGELEETHRCYSRCIDELTEAGHVSDILGCSTTLADVRVTQGRLRDARDALERALGLAITEDGEVRGAADMHRGLAEIALESNDITTAERHLGRAQELGERAGMPRHPYRLRVTMAGVREARGDLEEALSLLEEAALVYVSDFIPNVRPVPATRARVLVAAGRLADAHDWALRYQLSPTDELSYLHEYEHVTLATLLLADHQAAASAQTLRELSELLRRLRDATQRGGRNGTLIEVLILQSLTSFAAGDIEGAAAQLRQALALGEPEGYAGAFTRHGSALAPVFRLLPREQREAAYVRGLVAAGRSEETPPAPLSKPSHEVFVDPLSRRELQVLRLLATDMSGPELSRHLMVSLNTVRTHTRNVYTKLGVNGRRAAVSRARELDLLGRYDADRGAPQG